MKSILFIEDEAAIHKTFSDALGKEEYEITSALDGEIGLRLAKEKKPDLILLDLILPKMNGFQVLKALKADEGTKNIPVIVLTNLADQANMERGKHFNVADYFVKKDMTMRKLVEMVKRLLKL